MSQHFLLTAAARTVSLKQILRMEARILAIAHELIDQFIDTDHADLVRQYTTPLPLRVLLEFLGLPVEPGVLDRRGGHPRQLHGDGLIVRSTTSGVGNSCSRSALSRARCSCRSCASCCVRR